MEARSDVGVERPSHVAPEREARINRPHTICGQDRPVSCVSGYESRQVTLVNEVLVGMEQLPSIFLCPTNLVEDLDRASIRRFTMDVQFDYLKPAQAWALFKLTARGLGVEVERKVERSPACDSVQQNRRPALGPEDSAELRKRGASGRRAGCSRLLSAPSTERNARALVGGRRCALDSRKASQGRGPKEITRDCFWCVLARSKARREAMAPMDGEELLRLLLVLRDRGVELAPSSEEAGQLAKTRKEAADALAALLQRWVPAYLRAKFNDLREELGEDLDQEVRFRIWKAAALSAAPFEGSTPGEAAKWVRAIARRRALDFAAHAASEGKRRSPVPADEQPADVVQLHSAAFVVEVAPDRVLGHLELVAAEIARLHPRDADSVVETFWCFLDRQTGDDTETLIRRYDRVAAPGGANSRIDRKVYLGRQRADEAIDALEKRDELSEDDALFLRDLLGCSRTRSQPVN